MASGDKHWAQTYINGPLNGPDAVDETGPGTSFRQSPTNGTTAFPDLPEQKRASSISTAPTRVEEQTTGGSNNPFRQGSRSSKSGINTQPRETRSSSNGFQPGRSSGDLRREASHRRYMSGEFDGAASRNSTDEPHGKAPAASGRPRRASSLNQRYPGDKTHLPLEMLERENKLANRSPHLRKKHQPKADSIDALDDSISAYHHEGPYDAALFTRNSEYKYSPVAALRRSNNEALKATPEDKIKDSLNDHYPLDGTAVVPPGVPDKFGRVYHYQEGTDMQREAGGDYKRWPGVTYLPEDLKGKGEPSYSIEKALKERKDGKAINGEGDTFELQERFKDSESTRRSRVGSNPEGRASTGQSYAQWEQDRRKGHGRNVSGDLRKRVPVGSKRQED